MAAFKKTCTLIGVGPRKKGIGQNSGLPYDFAEVAIGVPRKNWDGQFVIRGRIAGEKLDELPLIPGVVCTALLFYENYEPQLIDIVGVE